MLTLRCHNFWTGYCLCWSFQDNLIYTFHLERFHLSLIWVMSKPLKFGSIWHGMILFLLPIIHCLKCKSFHWAKLGLRRSMSNDQQLFQGLVLQSCQSNLYAIACKGVAVHCTELWNLDRYWAWLCHILLAQVWNTQPSTVSLKP